MISVVIPCWGCGKYLRSAIDSVLVQHYADWELLVLDNASDDETASVVSLSVAENPSAAIRHIRLETRLPYWQLMKQGMAQAKGEFLLILHADDLMHPAFMMCAAKGMEEHPEVSIIQSARCNFGLSRNIVVPTELSIPKALTQNPLAYMGLMRREVWEKVGGYKPGLEEDRAEDWQFWIDCAKLGFKAALIPAVLWYYRVRSDGGHVNDKDRRCVATVMLDNPEYFTCLDLANAREVLK